MRLLPRMILLGMVGCGGASAPAITNVTVNGASSVETSGASSAPLDSQAPPGFGEQRISASVVNDGLEKRIEYGGRINIDDAGFGPSCVGFTGAAPALNLVVDQGLSFRMLVETGSQNTDTALVVRGPDGRFICNDEGGEGAGHSPILALTDTAAGVYQVWVTNVRSYASDLATLRITADASARPAEGATRAGLDRESTSGAATLRFGARSSPASQRVTTGGTVSAMNARIGRTCNGMLPTTPQLVVEVADAMPFLMIQTAETAQRGNPTLAVLTPSGEWLCNNRFLGHPDQRNTSDAALEIFDAQRGTYRVWVGEEGGRGPSETSVRLSREVRRELVDRTLAPASGRARLAANFRPDPQVVEVQVGGPASLSRIPNAEHCTGFATQAPTRAVRLDARLPLLRFFVEGGDTTLAVRKPDGSWLCNDDSYQGNYPTVDVTEAATGEYLVWVGAQRSSDAPELRARLNVTRNPQRHP